MRSLAALCCFALLFVGGCSWLPRAMPGTGTGVFLPQLLPTDFGGDAHWIQRIEARYGPEARRAFTAMVEINETQVVISALGLFGQVMLTARWDGSALHVSDPDRAGHAGIDPARILQDIQFAFWPCERWLQVLAGTEGVMECQTDKRELYWKGELAYTLQRIDPNRVALHNSLDGYHLLIDTREWKGKAHD